jgi:hypothetical protein
VTINTERLKELFATTRKFTDADLQLLREDAAQVNHMTGKQDAWFTARMTVELIDTIRTLDKTSSNLIKTTNTLTIVILLVTAIGVVVAIVK